jgi:hypothetical protein
MERDVGKRKKNARDRSERRKVMELVLLCFVGSCGRIIWLLTWSVVVDPLGWRGRGGRGPTQLTAGHHRDQKGRNVFFVPAGCAVADADHWWAAGLGGV